MVQLSIKPEEGTKLLLKNLDSRRMRDVLEKRFGLKGGRKKTLDAIGREYKITRERVRQIEAEALKQLAGPDQQQELAPLFGAMENHLKDHGDTMAEGHLMTTLADTRSMSHLKFLLTVGKRFTSLPETDQCHLRWTTDKTSASIMEKTVISVVEDLRHLGQPISHDALETLVREHTVRSGMNTAGSAAVSACVHASKLIRTNPYGEYGLTEWARINPRGVKDKAYTVLAKIGKPLHFREVAQAINQVGWTRRKAHPQTVHNELIKDKRFILVGRGLYALREWGYEAGTVGDVLVSILKGVGRPVGKDEIVKLVLEKRFVKPNTILLNLQNKALFKRTEEGKFTLA